MVTRGDGVPERPVGKILCVGRNDAAHARELGNAPPKRPIWFLKPPSSLVQTTSPTLKLPPWSSDVHHEVELVVRLGCDVPCGESLPAQPLDAAAVGLDLTARDVQQVAKEGGLPWTRAKGFDGAAPLGPLTPVADVAELSDLALTLEVNGTLRQSGRTSTMRFSVTDLLADALTWCSLFAGDLVFTGTPAGVGPLRSGDRLVATVEGRPALNAVVR